MIPKNNNNEDSRPIVCGLVYSLAFKPKDLIFNFYIKTIIKKRGYKKKRKNFTLDT